MAGRCRRPSPTDTAHRDREPGRHRAAGHQDEHPAGSLLKGAAAAAAAVLFRGAENWSGASGRKLRIVCAVGSTSMDEWVKGDAGRNGGDYEVRDVHAV